jgi:uncharacterized tellurite resistance protein B-like protein
MEILIPIVILVAVANILFAFNRGTSRRPQKGVRQKQTGRREGGTNGQSMEPLEIRLREEEVEGQQHRYKVQRVEAKGQFPAAEGVNLGFVVSVLDLTEMDEDGEPQPAAVISSLERFQEADTNCFQDRLELGPVQPGQCFRAWTSILTIIPETLVPPRSGRRQLVAFVLAVDLENPPTIRHGFLLDGRPLKSWPVDFEWEHEGAGWRDDQENRTESEELIVRLAVSIALCDGKLHESEAATIKDWIKRRLDLLEPGRREARKQRLNAVIRTVYEARKSLKVEVGNTLNRLNDIGDPAARMAAVELCLDVLAADGDVADTELGAVNAFARRLNVDIDQFEDARDKVLAGLDGAIDGDVDYRRILGIDPTWPQERIRAHLNKQYARWNSRAETLTDSAGRDHAEKMLDVIAAARKALLA